MEIPDAAASTTAILPLFPLRAVLFPGGLLPLRVFEPRYLDMVGRCMRTDSCFGVVHITDGDEVGPVSGLSGVGTSARIVDFERRPDGLLGLLCRGEQRFVLRTHTTQADGLHLGGVAWLPQDARELPAAHTHLAEVLRKVLPAHGKLQEYLQPDYHSAEWVSCRFAELMPLDAASRQRLLETDDALHRLDILAPLVK
jgi:Lon protease-like protein